MRCRKLDSQFPTTVRGGTEPEYMALIGWGTNDVAKNLRVSPFNEGLLLNTNFITRSISLESTFNVITRTVNQRKAELLAAAGVDPAESAPPQMLSDLAEKLRQERVPHRTYNLLDDFPWRSLSKSQYLVSINNQ